MNGAERGTALNLLRQGKVWVDSEGISHKISEMEPRYMRNVRGYLMRNGSLLAEHEYNRLAFGMQPSGDAACDAFDAILEELLDAISNPVPWLERTELVQALDARLGPPAPEAVRSTYVDQVRDRLVAHFPKLGEAKRSDLLDLYALLVLTSGEWTTSKNVHDAWAMRMSHIRPDHWSLIPYEELPEERKRKDDKYARAIREIASELNPSER